MGVLLVLRARLRDCACTCRGRIYWTGGARGNIDFNFPPPLTCLWGSTGTSTQLRMIQEKDARICAPILCSCGLSYSLMCHMGINGVSPTVCGSGRGQGRDSPSQNNNRITASLFRSRADGHARAELHHGKNRFAPNSFCFQLELVTVSEALADTILITLILIIILNALDGALRSETCE